MSYFGIRVGLITHVNSFELSKRNQEEVNMKKSVIISALTIAGLTAVLHLLALWTM